MARRALVGEIVGILADLKRALEVQPCRKRTRAMWWFDLDVG